jgi:hypothetical protein
MSELPPGFVLDQAPAASLPEGFTLDPSGPAEKPLSQWELFKRGLAAIGDKPSLALNVGPFRMAREFPGAVADAATLPGDVYAGKVDPTSPEGIDRTAGLAMLATPVNPAVRAGDFAIPAARAVERPVPGTSLALPDETATGAPQATRTTYEPILNLRTEKPPVPTADELKAAGDQGYTQARGMGVDYSSEAVAKLARDLKAGLEEKGIIPEIAPSTHAVLDKLTSPPAGSVAPLTSVDAARQAFGNLVMGGSAVERKAAKIARGGFEDFLAAGDPSTVVAGPAAAAGEAVTTARGNIAASKRSDRLTTIEDTAELRSAAANSGQNLDNSIRQRAVSLLTNPKQRAGFSPGELAAIERVARGSASANLVRAVGNLLGGGGGLGAAVTAGGGAMLSGAAGLGFAGAAAPLVGVAAKKAGNALTARALRAADEMVRARSPLMEQRMREAVAKVADPGRRAALMRAMGLAEEQP